MFQHQAVVRRNFRAAALPPSSVCDCLLVSQVRNCWSWNFRERSARFRVEDAPQVGQRQRCVPEGCFPFLTRLVWHSAHLLVFELFGTFNHWEINDPCIAAWLCG